MSFERGVYEQTDKNSATVDATAGGTSYHVARYTEGVLYVSTEAKSGTTPTLDVKVQTSPDNSTWYDLTNATITQFNDELADRLVEVSNFGKWVRAHYTIGGSGSPQYTVTAKWVFKT